MEVGAAYFRSSQIAAPVDLERESAVDFGFHPFSFDRLHFARRAGFCQKRAVAPRPRARQERILFYCKRSRTVGEPTAFSFVSRPNNVYSGQRSMPRDQRAHAYRVAPVRRGAAPGRSHSDAASTKRQRPGSSTTSKRVSRAHTVDLHAGTGKLRCNNCRFMTLTRNLIAP